MNTSTNTSANNSINVKGENLKLIRFRAPLYRANKSRLYSYKPNMSIRAPNHLASEEYTEAPFKYFTINKNELKAYTKYGMPFMKTWEPQEDLLLVDILHKPTRDALVNLIGAESLNIAFPVNGNKVSRVSNENTRNHDDNVLRAICDLGLDGYYMKKLENNNRFIFHSEIGLCKRAFGKLRIIDVEKAMEPPRAPTRRISNRARKIIRNINYNSDNTKINNSKNNNHNNNSKLNFTRKVPRMVTTKLSFKNLI